MEPNENANNNKNTNKNENDDHNEIDNNVSLFFKVGVVVLSILMIIGFGIKVLPGVITVTNTGSKRDLPIYCVNTEDKKVALSFDAAWGNGNLG